MARVVFPGAGNPPPPPIFDYLYAKAGKSTVLKYRAAFKALYEHLANFPDNGAPRPKVGWRIRIGIVTPYIVIYRHTEADDIVRVLRIVHGRRRITGSCFDAHRDLRLCTRLDRRAGTLSPSREFHDHRVDRQRIAFLGYDLLHGGVALGEQHVLHLHRLDHAQRFARFDLLPLTHRDRLDEAGHRAEQRAGGIAGLVLEHQRRERSLALGEYPRFDDDAGMGEREAVEDRAHLRRDGLFVDFAAPDRLAGRPWRIHPHPSRF